VANQARGRDSRVRKRGAGFDAESLRQIRKQLHWRDDISRTRSDDSRPAHSCARSHRHAWARGNDRAGAFHSDVERKCKTNRIGARSDQAVDMVEAGGFHSNERFAVLRRPKILDRHGEHVWPTRAGGSSNATAGREACIHHG
jgi:hypothetical protein